MFNLWYGERFLLSVTKSCLSYAVLSSKGVNYAWLVKFDSGGIFSELFFSSSFANLSGFIILNTCLDYLFGDDSLDA